MKGLIEAFKKTDVYKLQLSLETRATEKGKQKVEDNVERLIKETPSSIAPYGDLITPLLDPLGKRIKAVFREIPKRRKKIGGDFPVGFTEVKLLDPYKLSRITLDACLVAVCHQHSRQQLLCTIGEYIEHLDFERLAKKWDAQKWNDVHKASLKARVSTETRKDFVISILEHDGLPKIEPWSENKKARVGHFCWNELQHLVGNVFVLKPDQGKSHYISLTHKAQEKVDKGLAYLKIVEEPHPVLIAGPNQWSGMIANCYLDRSKNLNTRYVTTRNTEQEKAIERAIANGTLKPHMDADNIINRVSVSINEEINEFIKGCWDRDFSLNKKNPKNNIKIETKKEYAKEFGITKPFKEWNIKDIEALKNRRKAQHKQNRSIAAVRNLRGLDQEEIEEQFLTKNNRAWLSVKNDFRGRRNVLQFLNYQREDVYRGQIDFGNKMPLNEDGKYWLQVDVASLYGADKLDKAHHSIAANWTTENRDFLEELIYKPEDNIDYIMQADKPVQFLRAAYAYLSHLEDPNYCTGIPTYNDAGASGLTFIGGIMRCPKIGHYTNITATDAQDQAESPYYLIADGVNEAFKKETELRHRRKIKSIYDYCESTDGVRAVGKPWTKRPTMTWPYSATRSGMKGQTIEDVMQPAIDKYERREIDIKPFKNPLNTVGYTDEMYMKHCADYFGKTIEKVLKDTFPQADIFMKYIMKIAQVCAHQNVQFRYTSPAGFPMIQHYVHKTKGRELRLPFRDNILNIKTGKSTMKVLSYSEKNKIALGKAQRAASPNVVHCLDSTLLTMIINLLYKRGVKDIFIIHDAIAVHPNFVGILRDTFRECFIQLMTEHNILQNIYDENAWNLKDKSKLPNVPKPGDLDVTLALNSPSIFR